MRVDRRFLPVTGGVIAAAMGTGVAAFAERLETTSTDNPASACSHPIFGDSPELAVADGAYSVVAAEGRCGGM